MSAPVDLDEISEQATRYAPPRYRTPEAQACEDMIRRFRYGLFEKPPVDPPPVVVTRTSRIAELMRTLTYGEMIELVGEIWSARRDLEITELNLPGILWTWATSYGH